MRNARESKGGGVGNGGSLYMFKKRHARQTGGLGDGNTIRVRAVMS